jgi:hypothetical protein
MPGWLIAKGLASYVTDASPVASRARIARRVGSASAANVASRRAGVIAERRALLEKEKTPRGPRGCGLLERAERSCCRRRGTGSEVKMPKQETPVAEPTVSAWRGLCRTGGVAAWLLVVYSLATIVQLLVLGGQPTGAAQAFGLLQQNAVVGLLRLDFLTILCLPLYYLLFLGLFAGLWREDAAPTTLATVLAFVGVTLTLATPTALSMLPLSDKYAAAISPEAKSQLLAAGETILATDIWHGTGAFVGAMLLQSAAVLVSVVMLRTKAFGKAIAYIGIVTHGLDLAHVVLMPFLPTAGAVLMATAGPLYLVWLPLLGRRLLQLGRAERRT